jgi:excisionase family DNA binding protein
MYRTPSSALYVEQKEVDMLLNLEQLERETDVSKYTWRAWIRAGKLPHVRLGRRLLVEETDFRRFIAAGRVEAREVAGK